MIHYCTRCSPRCSDLQECGHAHPRAVVDVSLGMHVQAVTVWYALVDITAVRITTPRTLPDHEHSPAVRKRLAPYLRTAQPILSSRAHYAITVGAFRVRAGQQDWQGCGCVALCSHFGRCQSVRAARQTSVPILPPTLPARAPAHACERRKPRQAGCVALAHICDVLRLEVHDWQRARECLPALGGVAAAHTAVLAAPHARR